MWYKAVGWIHRAQEIYQCRLAETVKILLVSKKAGNFFAK